MMQLKGKVALITGAGRGIGKALALGFAREGADIVAVARTFAQVEETAREVKTLGAPRDRGWGRRLALG